MFRLPRFFAVFAMLAALWSANAAQAQTAPDSVTRSFVLLGKGEPAVLYEPRDKGAKARIAILAMHSNADYLEFSACTQLAQRGYRVLCANNSNSKSGMAQEGRLDEIMVEAGRGVAYLRSLPGIEKVVLFGHSGGATLMSAYQMIAEHGVSACRGPAKIYQCSDIVAGLPKADGLMLIDSNLGQATMALLSIDPAVTDERTGFATDPALDLFDPANGYDPKGAHYGANFLSRFQRGQGERMNRLIISAQHRLALIEAGKGRYADDEPLTIPGAALMGFNNKIFPQDLAVMAHTKGRYPLIHADGTITNEVIHSVRQPRNDQSMTPMMRGALATTVRGFLSTYAIRTLPGFAYGADAVQGIDWDSTYAATPANIAHVSSPLLVMGMTGAWEYLASEVIFQRAASHDKSIAFVEGATHLYDPCKTCEAYRGQYGDTLKLTYDHIDQWLSAPGRFATS